MKCGWATSFLAYLPMAPNRVFLLFVFTLCLGFTAGRAAPNFVTSPQASVLVCGGSMMNGDRFADSVLTAMREHMAGCRNVALVLHASHPTERDAMEGRLQRAFVHLLGAGVKAESLHRRDAAGAKELLATADGIFIGGGETFVLLSEMYRAGQLEAIRARVLAGVPLVGSSAGANVAGPMIGTTNDFPTADVPSLKALGVFPAVINPHHPLPEAKAECDTRTWKIKTYLRFNSDETVLGLSNASLARLHGGHLTLPAGRGWIYRGTEVRAVFPGDGLDELLDRRPLAERKK